MAVQKMAKAYRPLWKQQIPPYPKYWKGDPQLRVLLPLFWMRIVKPKKPIPPSIVHFEVHPQMSKLDVKNYLEKIYKVPVIHVRTEVREGKYIYSASGSLDDPRKEDEGFKAITKDDDKKYAYVTLGDGHTFKYPNLFASGKPEDDAEEAMEQLKNQEKKEAAEWDKRSIPSWFRR